MKLIRNVLLASGSSFKTVNVLFDNTIKQIGTGQIVSESVSEEYDFSGCLIMPGAVDMHTHILKGTSEDETELKRATQLAVKGGYTTLADLPYLTKKPVFTVRDIQHYRTLTEKNSFCDLALWGNCDFSKFPYHLDQMNDIWSAGIVGFSLMHPSPNNAVEDLFYEDIMDLFDTIYDADISFSFQGYDQPETESETDAENQFLEQRLSAIKKILRRLQDNPLHFIGIYDRNSIEILNVAFRRADLTYAVPALKLMEIVNKFNKIGPEADASYTEFIKLLFDSMKNGRLYTISTESGSKFQTADKLMSQAYSGYATSLLQWTVPWAFSELWKANKVSVQSCIRMLSENPAKRLGIFPQKGCIQAGSDADILIIDPNTPVKTNLKDEEGKPITLNCSVKAVFQRGNSLLPLKAQAKPAGKLIARSNTTRRKSSTTCWN
ncbi:MAG: amidohydrolase family protein [Candidatus Cloacimonadaceae bacterium]